MASPQPTPFVRFSKELFEAFYMNPPATVAACRLWLWVMRYTWGDFGKDETPDKSLGEVAEEVNLGKTTAHRTLEHLVRCRRLKVGPKGGYAIQKDYDLWREDPRPRADHWANRPQQTSLFSPVDNPVDNLGITSEIVPNVGMKPFPRWERNRSHVGEITVPTLGTRIRSKNTREKGEGAQARPPQLLPNQRTDTPTARADLGAHGYAPADHPDFRRLSFKLQDKLTERWEAAVEEARRRTVCRRCATRPKASEAWPFCRPCTACAACGAAADGKRKFSVARGEVRCNDCKEDGNV